MICPQCRSEYRDDILTCADCGVALVDQLTAAPENRAEADSDISGAEDDIRPILTTGSSREADAVTTFLKEAGFEVMRFEDEPDNVLGLGQSTSRILLGVNAADEKRATSTLMDGLSSGRLQTPRVRNCTVCGEPARDEAKFCDQCGQRL